MKVIRINADERKVEWIETDTKDGGKTLDCATCYNLIGNGCDLVDRLSLTDGDMVDIIFDDEGRLKGNVKNGFSLNSINIEIAGNAIVTMVCPCTHQEWVGFNKLEDKPENAGINHTIEQIGEFVFKKLTEDVEFFTLDEHPLPAGFDVYTF